MWNSLIQDSPSKRIPHETLARQVTTLVHGGNNIININIYSIIDVLISVWIESGLQEALVATSALYDNNINTLSTLSVNDVIKIFDGATVVELMLEPGTTVLQMAMKAKCFLTDSNIFYL